MWGRRDDIPWYLVAFVRCFVLLGLDVGELGTMVGTSALSSWNKERFASSRRENGVGDNSPERMGEMKRGQRSMHVRWKETISRPECLERES